MEVIDPTPEAATVIVVQKTSPEELRSIFFVVFATLVSTVVVPTGKKEPTIFVVSADVQYGVTTATGLAKV